MKKLIVTLLGPSAIPLFDFLTIPLSFLALRWLKFIRRVGTSRLPKHRQLFSRLGVFPVTDHYFEPLFNPAHLIRPLHAERNLPGIQWNHSGQLLLLASFKYASELERFAMEAGSPGEFFYNNNSYRAGDAEFLYCMIRHFKPRRIIEIGSGNSTKMAIAAIRANRVDDSSYSCDHICIEPFEEPWLEKAPVKVIRERLEKLDLNIFAQLSENDILFIDSSHVIRPQGDVVLEYLEIIPTLKSGVFIHVHDIFSPRDYPETWLFSDYRMWNEQYLLEAFLSHNPDFKIVGSLNYLKYRATKELIQALPIFGKNPENTEPGAFWFQKIN